MNKPLILTEHEMKQELTDVVNRYSNQLPMTMIVSALEELTRVCVGVANNQLEQAKQEYQKSLEESEGEEDG